MLRDATTRLRFNSRQDRQAFERMVEERPDLLLNVNAGVEMAEAHLPRRIRTGVMGATRKAIEANVAVFAEVALRELRRGPPDQRHDEDQCYAYRLGFETVAHEALDLRFGAAQPVCR